MGKFSVYNVPLRGLSEGIHEFKYTLDSKYFTLIDDTSDIKRGDVEVLLTVKKTIATFDFIFDINGVINIPCDRCLDDISMEVSSKNKLIVKFGATYSEESDEIVVIPEEDGEINVAWFLYEFITLSLPIKHAHPSGQCNKAMSSKLNKHKAVSVDDEDESDDLDEDMIVEDDSSADSRWNTLKDVNIED